MKLSTAIAAVCALTLTAGGAFALVPPPVQKPFPVLGVITALDPDAGAVTLNGPLPEGDGSDTPRPAITFLVNDKTRILKNGEPAPFEALVIRDYCKALLIRTPDGVPLALAVHAMSPEPPMKWAKGRIEKIDPGQSVFVLALGEPSPGGDARIVFYFDRSTKFFKDGQPAGPDALMIGDIAAVGFYPPAPGFTEGPIRAAVVQARTPPEMIGRTFGRIAEIMPRERIIVVETINPDREHPSVMLWLAVTDSTRIEKMGAAPFEALCVGDRIRADFVRLPGAKVLPALAVYVQPDVFSGRIVEIGPEKRAIVIERESVRMAFHIDREAQIVKNGRPAPFEALALGDFASVKYFCLAQANVAVQVVAKSPPLPPR